MERRREHRWAVDGLGEETARVLEDGVRTITVPVYLLPPGVKEGDVLRLSRSEERGGSVQITVELNEAVTARALARSRRALERARLASEQIDRGGDVRV